MFTVLLYYCTKANRCFSLHGVQRPTVCPATASLTPPYWFITFFSALAVFIKKKKPKKNRLIYVLKCDSEPISEIFFFIVTLWVFSILDLSAKTSLLGEKRSVKIMDRVLKHYECQNGDERFNFHCDGKMGGFLIFRQVGLKRRTTKSRTSNISEFENYQC